VNINIPEEARYIIGTLAEHGHEAYIVGGCVRDAVLGITPQDWDICTPALAEQTMQCFAGRHIVESGLRHGTITLVLDHQPFEITTYRVDGVYSDNRRPDSVEFITDLRADLSRRDFTINAMAYSPQKGIMDFFDGMADIQNHIIRCVGDADKRFQEDALRVMRALRFASVLNFDIEDKTSAAIVRNKGLLKNIAVERIAAELNKLIVGPNAGKVLSRYTSVLEEIIPEITAMIGFQQHNPHHYLDVWEHTVKSITASPAEVALRLTMLLHDTAKPQCYTEAGGIGHFYGHPQISAEMAKEILTRLKYDNDTIETVTQLVLYHDADIRPSTKQIKRWLNRIGEERFRQLLEIKKADAMAQAEKYRQTKIAVLADILPLLNGIIEQRQCFSLKDLAVNGRDLIAIGISEGVMIGKILNQLVDMVIDEQVENDRNKLIKAINDERLTINDGGKNACAF